MIRNMRRNASLGAYAWSRRYKVNRWNHPGHWAARRSGERKRPSHLFTAWDIRGIGRRQLSIPRASSQAKRAGSIWAAVAWC